MRTYLADAALLPQGWAENVLIEVEPSGNIAGIAVDAAAASGRAHPTASSLPGMIDLHSHAFQRALAGLTQRLGADAASFWSWRDMMYAFAAKITPEDQRAIAAQLYVELLKGGYTSVVEFHYLHHQPDGTPYAEPRGDVAGAARGGAGGRHRADAAARGLHAGRRGRQPAGRRAAPLRPRS